MSKERTSPPHIERLHPGLHWLILVPIFGLIPVWTTRARATSEVATRELSQALRAQVLAGLVVLIHLALQALIWFADWMWSITPDPDALAIGKYVPLLLTLATKVNVSAGIVEWIVLAVAGVRAAGGRPYPALGGKSEVAALEADDDEEAA